VDLTPPGKLIRDRHHRDQWLGIGQQCDRHSHLRGMGGTTSGATRDCTRSGTRRYYETLYYRRYERSFEMTPLYYQSSRCQYSERLWSARAIARQLKRSNRACCGPATPRAARPARTSRREASSPRRPPG